MNEGMIRNEYSPVALALNGYWVSAVGSKNNEMNVYDYYKNRTAKRDEITIVQ